jgi:4-diphosphocytidyl-2-C-methyl-D-erythritol kinase
MDGIMAEGVTILSPAKINLHLEVYPKRADGFHPILSIFQMVSLYDEITIRSLKISDVCTIDGNFDFPPEENIIWKCWNLFRRETGIRQGVAISVVKRIPQGAGLGGGSSNAGAVLRGLDTLFRTKIPPERLSEIGSEVGSDVPFFCTAPAAVVHGRGEFVQEIPARTDFWVVIVVPAVHISTKAAYGWIDAEGFYDPEEENRGENIVKAYSIQNPSSWNFKNAFYPVLSKNGPVFREVLDLFVDFGASYTNISGSGSAMFGVFLDREKALCVREVMAKKYPTAELTVPLDRMPDAILQ